MSRPWTTLPSEPGPRTKPSNAPPIPLISTIGLFVKPVWLVPLMKTGTVIVGSAEDTLITNGPLGILKLMESVWPGAAGCVFALRIARRSEPTHDPTMLSLMLVTWNGFDTGCEVVVANGEVLLPGSVTVAVMIWLVSSGVVMSN